MEATGVRKVGERIELVIAASDMDLRSITWVQAETSPETVVVNLLQLLPSAEDGTQRARVAFRFSITWPLAVRVRNLLDRIIARDSHRALEVMKATFTQGPAGESVGNEDL